MKNIVIIVFLIIALPELGSGQDVHQPNIVYILADDLGYGDVSCYNENSKLITPHIDQIARQGLKFTDAHTSSSVCTPTRYGILTGRYNWRSTLKNHVLSGFSPALIDSNRLTVASILNSKGYQTAFVGKWHLGWEWEIKVHNGDVNNLNSHPEVDYSMPIKNGPKDLGFTYSYGFSGSLDMPPYVYVENGMPTAIPTDTTVCVDEKGFWRKGLTSPDFDHVQVLPHLTDQAIKFIEEKSTASAPFFVYYALPAPHTPILPTTEFLGKSNTNFYGDFVLQVDHEVGQILNVLEDMGIAENTLVIFTSDNGCSPRAGFSELARVGHHPSYIFRGHKADIYEGGHRVPFVVRWPEKILPGQVSEEIICTTDLMATVAEIINFKLPSNAGEDSYSLLPLFEDGKLEKPLREATVHHSIDGRFAIRQGDWKLILWPGSGGWSYPHLAGDLEGLPNFQLYNLSADPGEENNLIEEHAEKAMSMKKLLASYVRSGRSTPGDPQTNDGEVKWKQLEWMD